MPPLPHPTVNGIANGTQVAVKCDKPTGTGWPDSFDVTVAASAGATDCRGSGSKTTTIKKVIKPVLDIQGPPETKVCSTESTKIFAYTLTSNTGTPITIESITPNPTRTCSITSPADTTIGEHMPSLALTCVWTLASSCCARLAGSQPLALRQSQWNCAECVQPLNPVPPVTQEQNQPGLL